MILSAQIFLALGQKHSPSYLAWSGDSLLHLTESRKSISVISPTYRKILLPIPVPRFPLVAIENNVLYLGSRAGKSITRIEGQSVSTIGLKGALWSLNTGSSGVLASTYVSSEMGIPRSFALHQIKGRTIVKSWGTSGLCPVGRPSWFIDEERRLSQVNRNGSVTKIADFSKQVFSKSSSSTLLAANERIVVFTNGNVSGLFDTKSKKMTVFSGRVTASDVRAHKNELWVLAREKNANAVYHVGTSGKSTKIETKFENGAIPYAGPAGLLFIDGAKGDPTGEAVTVYLSGSKLVLKKVGQKFTRNGQGAFVNSRLLITIENGELVKHQLASKRKDP